MKIKNFMTGLVLAGVTVWGVLVLARGPLAGQTGGDYELSRTAVFQGGAAAGGIYEVQTVGGQAEVGSSSGGLYTLGQGFWGGGSGQPSGPAGGKLFLPFVNR